MIICCLNPSWLPSGPLCTAEVSVFRAQCHFCLPIQVVFPVILSFRRKTPSLVYSQTSSVFTFTSCLFSDISLRAVHTVWLRRARRTPPKGRSLAGLGGGSSLAVRKLALIGLVVARSRGPPLCHPGTCQGELLEMRARRRVRLTVGMSGGKKESKCKTERLSKWEPLERDFLFFS